MNCKLQEMKFDSWVIVSDVFDEMFAAVTVKAVKINTFTKANKPNYTKW